MSAGDPPTSYEDLMAALRAYWTDADAKQAAKNAPGCPNGPDPETGEWPCNPKGYFGVFECQTCGRIAARTDSA